MASSKIEHVMIEIIPGPTNRESIFLLNVYSSPKDLRQRFKTLLSKAVQLSRGAPLIIAGDFNAPHHTWGYSYDTRKGEDLWRETMNQDLMLVTDPAFPTRCGTSSSRDTTPDLTFVRNVAEVNWTNLNVDFGSDHYLLATVLRVGRTRQHKFRVTDWDKFRKLREERSEGEEKLDLERWTAQIGEDIRATTKEITTDLPVGKMDSRLAHLLEAKQSLLTRWKGQRLNRRLRKKIAEVNRSIEEHCKVLSKQQWDEVCNSVDGQMRRGGPWNLLKHLLNENNTKSNQRCTLTRILHAARQGSSDNQVLAELVGKYLPIASGPPPSAPDYAGGANPELDAEFGIEEIRQAMHDLNGRSAPGPDKITNKALRNLDDRSVEYLTDAINQAWRSGRVPEMWKTATTILIPKPGKPPSLDNLLPISLTSCVGKVAEHAILNRVSRYLEDRDIYPHNMIGFRPSIATQGSHRSQHKGRKSNTGTGLGEGI
ncbi:uncharacterized protein LOC119381643 [Rhipicephalus sanguineus]|uniref:uncharacterized protein LOC119381643 n=1 Tax=Rhipicephalus sanguineus TaxID=34632 RepID=UPI0018955167|nr:uncharacterized protein LOC119381643 [Rhipicephalus sanguineus]